MFSLKELSSKYAIYFLSLYKDRFNLYMFPYCIIAGLLTSASMTHTEIAIKRKSLKKRNDEILTIAIFTILI